MKTITNYFLSFLGAFVAAAPFGVVVVGSVFSKTIETFIVDHPVLSGVVPIAWAFIILLLSFLICINFGKGWN